MIYKCINDLVKYGIKNKLIEEDDKIYTINKLLELFELKEYPELFDGNNAEINSNEDILCLNYSLNESEENVQDILDDMIQYATDNKIINDITATTKDLFDTKIMGIITPQPSVIRKEFAKKYEISSKEATDYYYSISKATNYIRTSRIAKDEKWTTSTEYGDIDITINLSKPEKDPKDIEKAGKAKTSGYPKCLLCVENEGYAGHLLHPARQNHRIIPIDLCGEKYYIQYSPYVYYNEHCIVFNEKHIPMKINKETFDKLLKFVTIFPHYMIGSNADLPIVGGSILSHDHFQGGNYEFAMAKAPIEKFFKMNDYKNITAGIVKWPMSVIRLQGNNRSEISEAAEYILNKWKNYTDERVFIFSNINNTPHNTITPIARRRGELYELDLVLRNNITTDEYPIGMFHPHQQFHNIKKENIGLIEVMGLAILPARLKQEMAEVEKAIIENKDISAIESIKKHSEWVESFINKYEIANENIHEVIQKEIGLTFSKILECAGVFKRTDEGQDAFLRFVNKL